MFIAKLLLVGPEEAVEPLRVMAEEKGWRVQTAPASDEAIALIYDQRQTIQAVMIVGRDKVVAEWTEIHRRHLPIVNLGSCAGPEEAFRQLAQKLNIRY